MNRREFIKKTGIAAMAITLTPYMTSCAQKTDSTIIPVKENDSITGINNLIYYAAMAASSHNTQPWKFKITQNEVAITLDKARLLPVVDPEDREAWISLGCALENLLIAAETEGYQTSITLPKDGDDSINIGLALSNQPATHPLFDSISKRQCTRSEFSGEPVPDQVFKKIMGISPENKIYVDSISESNTSEKLYNFITDATLQQYQDVAFVDELVSWLRFNKTEAEKSQDGLFSACSGNPTVPRFFGKLFVSTKSGPKTAEDDVTKIKSSSGVIIISSYEDTPSCWVNTGRTYQRLALTMTSLGVKSALHNQPLEIPAIRKELSSELNLSSQYPQLLLRYGYADLMPMSLRRPVEEIISV